MNCINKLINHTYIKRQCTLLIILYVPICFCVCLNKIYLTLAPYYWNRLRWLNDKDFHRKYTRWQRRSKEIYQATIDDQMKYTRWQRRSKEINQVTKTIKLRKYTRWQRRSKEIYQVTIDDQRKYTRWQRRSKEIHQVTKTIKGNIQADKDGQRKSTSRQTRPNEIYQRTKSATKGL